MSHERVSLPPWLIVVALSAVALYMIVGLVGSLTRSHSQDASDEDQYWFLGFYNNPDDYDLFVLSPIFRRRTVNIGHPVGLAFTIVMLLAIVALDILVAVLS